MATMTLKLDYPFIYSILQVDRVRTCKITDPNDASYQIDFHLLCFYYLLGIFYTCKNFKVLWRYVNRSYSDINVYRYKGIKILVIYNDYES